MFYLIFGTMPGKNFTVFIQRLFADYKIPMMLDLLKNQTCILDLPEECLLLIFENLDQKDLIACSNVCKQWQDTVVMNRSLWKAIKLQSDFHVRKNVGISRFAATTKEYDTCSFANRRIVQFLVRHDIHPDTIMIKYPSLDTRTHDTLSLLISSGCCHRLTSCAIKWCEDWNFSDSDEFATDLSHFLSIMSLLKEYTGISLHRMKTQLIWTAESVRHICEFKQLSHIELNAFPRVQCVYRSNIEKLLDALQNLESLKLTVTVMPKFAERFSFKSESLLSLDISDCVNFFIEEMHLPNLHTFCAVNIQCHRMALFLHTFCLHTVLRNGCPRLRYIHSGPADKTGNHASAPSSAKGRICFCHEHRKSDIS